MSAKSTKKLRRQTPRQPKLRTLTLEKNIWDLNASLTCANAYGVLSLASVSQGASYNQRDGAILHPEFLQVRGVIAMDPAGANSVRIILAQLHYDQANLTATDAVAPLGGVNWNITGAYNRDFVGQGLSDRRMTILHDETFVNSTNWHATHHYELRIRLSGIIRYLQSNATNVPIDGGLVLFYCDAPTTAVHATVQHYSRLVFTDA